MATSWGLTLKIAVRFDIKNGTETEIRTFFANLKPEADTFLQNLVAAAPAPAEAVFDSTDYKLKVYRTVEDAPSGLGSWEAYPKIVLHVTVADTVTEAQIRNYVEGYFDDVKQALRNRVDAIPNNRGTVITDWHVHRAASHGDEVE
jgi:hypothetical protein